jgi:hypothetical protein
LHEPYPKISLVSDSKSDPLYQYKESFYKLKTIYVKRSVAGKYYYAECNHLFIKTFASYAIDYFGDKIRVIHLIRDPFSVAKSIYNLGEYPGTTEVARRYWLDPASNTNILKLHVLLSADLDQIHPFYRCLWYWYENEARTVRLKEEYPWVFKSTIQTNELNDVRSVNEMLVKLELPFNPKDVSKMIGIRKNERKNEKKSNLNIENAMQMARKFHLSVMSFSSEPYRSHFDKYYQDDSEKKYQCKQK